MNSSGIFGQDHIRRQDNFAADGYNLIRIWVLACILLIVIKIPSIVSFKAHDPDDYTRLLQVRDWLAGQSWYDTRQYRMNPPVGADIHWMRLGDLPIAAVLFPLKLFLPQRFAEIGAMIAVPLLELLVAMVLLRSLMRSLGMTTLAITAGLVMLPLFPMLSSNFAPLRIDYHAWIGICALAITGLLVRDQWKYHFAAGLTAALALTLSLECMPFIIGAGGFLAIRYWLYGERGHDPYFVGLAVGSIALTLLFRPPHDFFRTYCDVLSAPHLAAFTATALLISASRQVARLNNPMRRLLVLVPVPVLAAYLIMAPLGACAMRPLATVDPLVRSTYFDLLEEAGPVTIQQFSVQVMLVTTLVLASLGGWMVVRRVADPVFRKRWATVWSLAVLASLISLALSRAAITAQILAIPFCAVLLTRALPKARAIRHTGRRVITTIGCLGLTTPILPTAVAARFDQPLVFQRAALPYLQSPQGPQTCDFDRLNSLPPSHLFTPLVIAPYLLAITPHYTVASTYHRNDVQIRDVILAFTGPLDQAKAILAKYHTDYVVFCQSDIEMPYLASKSDGLARHLVLERAPDWLAPVPELSQGAMRVYRVR